MLFLFFLPFYTVSDYWLVSLQGSFRSEVLRRPVSVSGLRGLLLCRLRFLGSLRLRRMAIGSLPGQPDLISARPGALVGFRGTQPQLSEDCPFLYSPLLDELVRLGLIKYSQDI